MTYFEPSMQIDAENLKRAHDVNTHNALSMAIKTYYPALETYSYDVGYNSNYDQDTGVSNFQFTDEGSDQFSSLYETIRNKLEQFGIDATANGKDEFGMSQYGIYVNMKQPNVETKIQHFVAAHKAEIFADYDKRLAARNDENLAYHMMGNYRSLVSGNEALKKIDSFIPRNTDGTPLNPEQAAQVIAAFRQDLETLGKKLGVSAMVEALTKPRTGRGRGMSDSELN